MREAKRIFPPDYVSAETLAYCLDCSRATIDAYVREGWLPKPYTFGNLSRWDFAEVRAHIRASNQASPVASRNGVLHDPEDPYLEALSDGPAAQA
jgi:predicted DNA-binding transcriptional regulator AlpA